MKLTRLIMIALMGLALLSPPAAAQSIGIGFGGFYGPGFYSGWYPYGGFGGPYGAPVYSRPMVVPQGGSPMIAGAYGYIDEGDFRNYRDSNGEFMGRMPIVSIPAGRW